MIIGTMAIDTEALVKNSKTAEQFNKFCESLVPEEFRHIHAITDNQKYICCMIYRRLKNVAWPKKRELLNEVLRGLHIIGFADMIIEASSLMGMVDQKRIEKFKEIGL